MDKSRYSNNKYGQVLADFYGDWPHGFFMPAKTPRDYSPQQRVSDIVSQAQLALGKLSGLAIDQELIVPVLYPSMANEALESSRIEGTNANLSEVLQDGTEFSIDVAEVKNYLAASAHGLELIKKFPITQRVLKQIHRTLMTGVRGDGKFPGEFRTSPVWLGSGQGSGQGSGSQPAQATYIPPLPEFLPELFADLEDYINNPSDQPLVIRLALSHYQFETIHPFLDGNGRIGRLLIGLQLVTEGLMESPALFLSEYIYQNRSEYYTKLQAVHETADLDSWVEFFARAVIHQSNQTIAKLSRLLEIQQRYLENSQTKLQRQLVKELFAQPLISVKQVQLLLAVSQPTASKLIRSLEQNQILRSRGQSGRGRKETWFAPEIWAQHTGQNLDNN